MSNLQFDLPNLSQWPTESRFRASLLELITAPDFRKERISSDLEARFPEKLGGRRSSLPAFQAHVTMALQEVCARREVDSDAVPHLAYAINIYLESSHPHLSPKVKEEVRKLAAALRISSKSVINLMRDALSTLYEGGTARRENGASANNGTRYRMTPETKFQISCRLLELHAESPIQRGDVRIPVIAEEFNATVHQVNALRAWLTIRTQQTLKDQNIVFNDRIVNAFIRLVAQTQSMGQRWDSEPVKAQVHELKQLLGNELPPKRIRIISEQIAEAIVRSE